MAFEHIKVKCSLQFLFLDSFREKVSKHTQLQFYGRFYSIIQEKRNLNLIFPSHHTVNKCINIFLKHTSKAEIKATDLSNIKNVNLPLEASDSVITPLTRNTNKERRRTPIIEYLCNFRNAKYSYSSYHIFILQTNF